MRAMMVLVAVAVMGLCSGCSSTKDGVSWNMRQSITRAGGDAAATAILDAGANKAELIAFTEGLAKLIEQGTLTKSTFQAQAQKLAKGNQSYLGYIDSVFALLPTDLGVDQLIPPEVKVYLLSFIRDGGLHGEMLYDESKRPAK